MWLIKKSLKKSILGRKAHHERMSLDDKMFESLILLRMNRDFFEYGEELVKNNVIQCDFSQVMDIEVNEESDDGDNSGNSTSKRRKLDGNNAVKNVG